MQGKVYWARAKEMHRWNPVFREDKYGYNSSDEESMGVGLEGIRGDTIKLLNKQKGEGIISSEDNLQYPPGFTPTNKGVHLSQNLKYDGKVAKEAKITNLEDHINVCSQEVLDKAMWGNYAFDYAISPSLGNSSGIICVWESSMFVKENVSVPDSFLLITGTWVPMATRLLIISMYAPQELVEKKLLWEYLCHVKGKWDGECLNLGDFNEVRMED
ncbi:hypothetical protein Tco_0622710 [Tanacetum coccineum]